MGDQVPPDDDTLGSFRFGTSAAVPPSPSLAQPGVPSAPSGASAGVSAAVSTAVSTAITSTEPSGAPSTSPSRQSQSRRASSAVDSPRLRQSERQIPEQQEQQQQQQQQQQVQQYQYQQSQQQHQRPPPPPQQQQRQQQTEPQHHHQQPRQFAPGFVGLDNSGNAGPQTHAIPQSSPAAPWLPPGNEQQQRGTGFPPRLGVVPTQNSPSTGQRLSQQLSPPAVYIGRPGGYQTMVAGPAFDKPYDTSGGMPQIAEQMGGMVPGMPSAGGPGPAPGPGPGGGPGAHHPFPLPSPPPNQQSQGPQQRQLGDVPGTSSSSGPAPQRNPFEYVPTHAAVTRVHPGVSRARGPRRRRTGSKRSLEEMILESTVPTNITNLGTHPSMPPSTGPAVSLLSASGSVSGPMAPMPLTLTDPPLATATPPNANALQPDPQPRPKKKSKYSAEQDAIILKLKREGKSWTEIAAAADCGNALAARNRYQVLIGQQGGGTVIWDADDAHALKALLEEAERAKWNFIASELSRMRSKHFSPHEVRGKIKQLFDQNPSYFGVVVGDVDLPFLPQVSTQPLGYYGEQLPASQPPQQMPPQPTEAPMPHHYHHQHSLSTMSIDTAPLHHEDYSSAYPGPSRVQDASEYPRK